MIIVPLILIAVAINVEKKDGGALLPENTHEEGIKIPCVSGKYDLMPLILPSFAFLAGMIPTYFVNSHKKAYKDNEVGASLVSLAGLGIAFFALFLVIFIFNQYQCRTP